MNIIVLRGRSAIDKEKKLQTKSEKGKKKAIKNMLLILKKIPAF